MSGETDVQARRECERKIRRALGSLYTGRLIDTPEEAALFAPVAEKEAEAAIQSLDTLLAALASLASVVEAQAEQIAALTGPGEAGVVAENRSAGERAQKPADGDSRTRDLTAPGSVSAESSVAALREALDRIEAHIEETYPDLVTGVLSAYMDQSLVFCRNVAHDALAANGDATEVKT